MKLASICATVLLAFATPAVTTQPTQDVDYRGIALVHCGRASGTAFWISPTRIITAAHVSMNGECRIGGVPVEKVREDGDLDFAELRGISNEYHLEPLCRRFSRGRVYRAIGYMGGRFLATLPVRATRWRNYRNNGNGLRVFEGEMHPGMSGGPVVDANGRVRGIVNRRWPASSRELSDTFLCVTA